MEANRDEIDIVILDIILPDMSERETYDRLKGINPDIKVLLSSDYSINGHATQILERGYNAEPQSCRTRVIFLSSIFSMKPSMYFTWSKNR